MAGQTYNMNGPCARYAMLIVAVPIVMLSIGRVQKRIIGVKLTYHLFTVGQKLGQARASHVTGTPSTYCCSADTPPSYYEYLLLWLQHPTPIYKG